MYYRNKRRYSCQEDWMLRNGFNTDGVTYCIVGEDTYSIKDALKEMGCTYNSLLGWHCDEVLSLTEDYSIVPVEFDEVFEWNQKNGMAFDKETAAEHLAKKFGKLRKPSNSEFLEGEIGQRLYHLTVTFVGSYGFVGRYGWINIYKFKQGDNAISWFSTKEIEIEKGTAVDLTGTIKNFSEYREEKTTILTRCIVRKIG